MQLRNVLLFLFQMKFIKRAVILFYCCIGLWVTCVAQIKQPQQPTTKQFQPSYGGSVNVVQPVSPKPVYQAPKKSIPDDIAREIDANPGKASTFNLYEHPTARANDENFEQAFQLLRGMLQQNEPDFKKAVFITEMAYGSNISYQSFDEQVTELAERALWLAKTQADIQQDTLLALTWAIKHLMVDTINSLKNGALNQEVTFTYDFEDVFGADDVQKMFVTKLLKKGTGNCHSFPYLYKILAQELGIGDKAHLAYAPNHVFIRMKLDERWWNLELTNGYFLQDWFMMATGYIHVPGIQGKIYMTPLTEQESIAACIMDLATYYEHKYGMDNFLLKCCELALEYYPNCIQALMVKANCWNTVVSYKMDQYGLSTAEQARRHPSIAKDFATMESVFALIDEKGYVPVPEEQYLQWLESMEQEKEKRAGFK